MCGEDGKPLLEMDAIVLKRLGRKGLGFQASRLSGFELSRNKTSATNSLSQLGAWRMATERLSV